MALQVQYQVITLCLISSVLSGPLTKHAVRKRQLTEPNGYAYDYDTNDQPYAKVGESNEGTQADSEYESLIYNRPAVKYKDFDSIDAPMSNLAGRIEEDDFKRPVQQSVVVKSPISVGSSRDDFTGLKETEEKRVEQDQETRLREQAFSKQLEKIEEKKLLEVEKSPYVNQRVVNQMNGQESRSDKFKFESEPVKSYYNQARQKLVERKSDIPNIESRPVKGDDAGDVNYDTQEEYQDDISVKEKRNPDDSDQDDDGDAPSDSDEAQTPVKIKGKRDISDEGVSEPKIILPVLLSNFKNSNLPVEGQGKDPTSKREASRSSDSGYHDSLFTLEDKHRIESALDKLLKDAILSRGSTNSFVDPAQSGLELNDLLNEDQLRAIIRGTNAVILNSNNNNNNIGAKKVVSPKSSVRALNYNSAPRDSSNPGSQCKCQVINALTAPPVCNGPMKMEEAIVNSEEDSIVVDIKRTTRTPTTCNTISSSSCAGGNINAAGLDS